MMDKLLIIQPLIASYRKDLYDELTNYFNVVDVYANLNAKNGFKSNVIGKFNSINTPFIGNREKIYYQVGIISAIFKNKPTAIYLSADFRALHYFIILIVAKILNIPIFPHGQSLFNKPNPSLIHRFLFKFTISLSSSYICYTKSARQTLLDIGIEPNKLSIMDNTIINNYPIEKKEKKEIKNKLLYIGRLRKGCNLKLLFDAIKILSIENLDLSLDIIGDGEEALILKTYAKELKLNINFLGAIYDDKKISELSKEAIIGIYPGDAGLSVVHYMSLSLIPIVHSKLHSHMGPEPSYIIHGYNGFNFIRNNQDSLANCIKSVLSDKNEMKKVSKNAFETYKNLSTPTMATKLIKTMNNFIKRKK
jgi:glycosyltransferase involved in cell wall biosynthesis